VSSNKVLLHACCAPCLTNSIQELEDDGFSGVVYFYNPNIYPEAEYQKRLKELINFCENNHYSIIVENDDFDLWQQKCSPLKEEKEGGKRCLECFKIRLEKSAKYAQDNNFDYFCTTLTISPHKNTENINKTGKELEKKYNITFLEKNFKKNDGFKKSLELSKKHNLFRQTYCGCEYSIKH
jgi:epoxyqueuosine reductase